MKHLSNTRSERRKKTSPSGPLKLLIVAPLFLATIFAVSIAGLAFYCLHRCGGQGKSNLIKVLRLLLAGPPLLVLGIVALCVAVPSWCVLCFFTPSVPRLCHCGQAEIAAGHDLCRACLEVTAMDADSGPDVLHGMELDMAAKPESWLPPGWLHVGLEDGESLIVARSGNEGDL